MKEAQIQAATVSEIREHFRYVTRDCENHEEIICKAKHPSSLNGCEIYWDAIFFDEVEYIDFGGSGRGRRRWRSLTLNGWPKLSGSMLAAANRCFGTTAARNLPTRD